MNELSNKTVIVTGAAGGLGEAITTKCLEQGAKVIACDLNNKQLKKLEKLKYRFYDDPLFVFPVDVSDYKDVKQFFSLLNMKFSSIDGLVNNAGIYLGKDLLDYTPDQMDKVINVNIKGATYFSQFFGELLLQRKDKGCIVNISSVAGQEGSTDAIYGLSKAALIGLTKSCALNFSPNIRVNAVTPGLVETRMMEDIPEWRVNEYREKELLNDRLQPQDVANTVAFLLSDAARNYSGSVFDINNGCYMR
ncbi:SDR family NAD(P)-dependent oxidoreductase [Chengkuizengella axinellae]|uniref:SDR family oxidoreductase n=1 Tax=Chengkuizengella axinellae TaxID=3064388 RepID=A0ABT9IXS3_9BACL|nr:SDR family oxidoreductase [Chengkuizengella sp. 2205SS18-9]MDP5274113.1 SDR family oxidoreductase [Chengkuizengella sp. 2205SS18-9]